MTQVLVLSIASFALVLGALSISLPGWATVILAFLPWAPEVFFFIYGPPHAAQYLQLHPHQQWQVVYQDEKNNQLVLPLQSWSHFFGMTISLKILNCPHNKQETVRMTLWRCMIVPELYRRMCVMVAWRLDQAQAEQELESV